MANTDKQDILKQMAEQLEIAKAAFAKAIALANETGVEFTFNLGINFPHPYSNNYGDQGIGGTYYPARGEGEDAVNAYMYWDASSMNC